MSNLGSKKWSVATVVFCIAAAVVVISMFLNWLVIDLDLGYFQLNDIAEDINVFTLPGMLSDIKEVLSPWSAMLPKELVGGLETAAVFSYLSLVLGICAIVCYVLSVLCRVTGKNHAARLGRWADVLAFMSSAIFVVLLTTVVDKLAGEKYALDLFGDVIMGPCGLVAVGTLVSLVTAGRDQVQHGDWVRRYTERIDTTIDEHPHDPETEWVCSSCMSVNKQEHEFCKCGCGVGLK